MNRTAIAAMAAFAALLAAQPSNAADLARPVYHKAPAYQTFVPAAFSWQGFYVGFNGGYGVANTTLANSTFTSETFHPNGALVGSTFGYNFQTGGAVYGIEGDVDYSWMRAAAGPGAPCSGCEVRNHYLATVRGRLGYAMDRWLPYVTGGAAFGDIQTSTPGGGSQSTNKVGWTAGGGVEYALPATNWSAKLEYLYADLGTATCDAAHCGVSTDTTFRANVVRVGINYHY